MQIHPCETKTRDPEVCIVQGAQLFGQIEQIRPGAMKKAGAGLKDDGREVLS
jgi:hypothetical protein